MARALDVDEAGTVRIFGLQVCLDWMIDPTTWAWVASSHLYSSQELLEVCRTPGGGDTAPNTEGESR